MTTLKDVKTGDILTWKRDKKNLFSDLLIRGIRFFTGGDYGHVAVAIRFEPYVFVVEASLPMVKLTLVDPDEEIFHIPMNQEPFQEGVDFLITKLGLPYGIADDLRAEFGITLENDNKWQCAELTKAYLSKIGTSLDCKDIPDSVVKAIIQQYHKPIFLLKKD